MVKKNNRIQQYYFEKGETGLFVKAGSIIPRKFLKRLSSMQTLRDSFQLDVFLSPTNN
jgi:hypothetical protein